MAIQAMKIVQNIHIDRFPHRRTNGTTHSSAEEPPQESPTQSSQHDPYGTSNGPNGCAQLCPSKSS